MRAISKFPKFCEESKDGTSESALLNACKVELATFLAHMKHESGSLMYLEEIGCSVNGAGCDYSTPHNIYPPT